MEDSKTKISLTLLVDTSSNKVLFAEAGKDFVDFLFGLLELPLGTILSLLTKHHNGSRSLCRVYDSVSNIGNEYLQSNQIKNSLLSPKIAAGSETQPNPLLKELLLKELAYDWPQPSGSRSSYYSSQPVLQGYVKEAVTYMVMDDLTVKPVSTISTVARLNSLKVKDLSSLKEKIVDVDMDQGLKMLLKASFHSITILTDVFLSQAKAGEEVGLRKPKSVI